MYVCIHIVYIDIHTYGCDSSGPPHPALLHTFVAGPLLQTFVACLCVAVVFNRLVARKVCHRTPRFCNKPCRKKAARACYKPDVFEALPYICIYIYIYMYLPLSVCPVVFIHLYLY